MKFGAICLTVVFLAWIAPILDAQGLSVACTTPVGPGAIGPYYTYRTQCVASGGVSPYTWSIVGGSLPAGLTLSPAGVAGPPSDDAVAVSGKPTTAGVYNYAVQATDGKGQTGAQIFAGTIANAICFNYGVSGGPLPLSTFAPSGGSSGIGFLGFRSVGCPWEVTADVPWITFPLGHTSGTTFAGPFPATGPTFAVAPNPDPVPRHGNVFVTENGVVTFTYPITVNSDACTYAISSSPVAFGPAGGSKTLSVTSTPADCVPMVTTPSWIEGNPPTEGTYYYGALPNFGPSRTGILKFGPQFGIASGSNAAVVVAQDAGDNSFMIGCITVGVPQVGNHFANCMSGAGSASPWSLKSGALPPGLTVPFLQKQSLGAPTLPGPYDFTLQAKDTSVTPKTATYRMTGTIVPSPKGTLGMNCSARFHRLHCDLLVS